MQSIGSSTATGAALLAARQARPAEKASSVTTAAARPAYNVSSVSTASLEQRQDSAKTRSDVASDKPREAKRVTIETYEGRESTPPTKIPTTVSEVAAATAANAYRAQQHPNKIDDQRSQSTVAVTA